MWDGYRSKDIEAKKHGLRKVVDTYGKGFAIRLKCECVSCDIMFGTEISIGTPIACGLWYCPVCLKPIERITNVELIRRGGIEA